MNQRFLAFGVLAAWAVGWSTLATLAAPETAIITGNRANLRASPAVSSEVVGTLLKGQSIVVLEQIPVSNPAPDEPPSWAKIRLPASVRVWVYAAFIDPKSGTVTARELKVRSGQGRNFAAIGELSQGDLVVPIRTVDGWMQIEPPADAAAYVAGNLLQLTGSAGASPATPPRTGLIPQPERSAPGRPITPGNAAPGRSQIRSENLGAAPVAATPPSLPAANNISPTELTTLTPATPIVSLPPATVNTTSPGPAPTSVSIPASTPTTPPTPVATALAPVEVSAGVRNRQPELIYDETRPRRVLREGIVRMTVSPDGPGAYQLDSFRHGEGTQDYLIPLDKKKTDLGKWFGKRVFIEGDEYRDRRWRTPVLKVVSIQAAF